MMKNIIKKTFFAFWVIMLSLSVATSDVAAKSIGGGGSITVGYIIYNFDVKYITTDGTEIDPGINYSDSIIGYGSIDLERKQIADYVFEGYYYADLKQSNVQGSIDDLIRTNPPKAATMQNGKDADDQLNADGKKTASYTVYMVYGRLADTQTYSLLYDANGGVGEVTDSVSPYAENSIVTVLDGDTLSKENYTFTGWNTVADGTGDDYAPGGEIVLTNDIVLYAQWELIKTTTPPEKVEGPEAAATEPTKQEKKEVKKEYPKTGDDERQDYMTIIMASSLSLLFMLLNKKTKEEN